MKAEIFLNGPIACSMYVTDKFQKEYKAGQIYSEKFGWLLQNHEISIVGWGIEEKTGREYWICRNSWGNYWGDYGFFLMQMHKDNLNIENMCMAAIPSITKVTNDMHTTFVQ